jgi:signal transduction histidine kinase/CheY-like chemotaxis protein
MEGNEQKPKVLLGAGLTRSWHANMATKLTAMALWSLGLIGFLSIFYFLYTFKKDVNIILSKDFAYIKSNIEKQLQKTGKIDPLFLSEERGNYFHSIHIKYKESNILVGKPSGHKISKKVFFEKDGIVESFLIEGFHPTLVEVIQNKRRDYIALLSFFLALVAISSILIIKHVFTAPIQILVNAVDSVVNGNFDIRIDENREDEFGKLATFFNRMLDRLSDQQVALKKSNTFLVNENKRRREIEGCLRDQHDKLEILVKERTKELEEARDQAINATASKSHFLANMSHEIRTPLTNIVGYTETLLRNSQEKSSEKSLLIIKKNGNHLLELINDILDLSKVEANKIELEKMIFSPYEEIEDVVTLLSPHAKKRGSQLKNSFQFPTPKRIYNDPTRFKQIILNLVSNALKFTEDGEVVIQTQYDELENKIRIDVVDSGIGMSAENLAQIFTTFGQADKFISRKYGGTGLGLTISKNLIQLMGGDLTVKSEENVGSTFTAFIDCGEKYEMINSELEMGKYRREAVVIDDQKSEYIFNTGFNILVVDDNEDIRDLIGLFMEDQEVNYETAGNGEEAIEKAQSKSYSLILMDVQMPGVSGIEATREIRRFDLDIPIIFLTANVMKEDIELYKRVGGSDFVAKPIDWDELRDKLIQFDEVKKAS